MHDSLVPSPDPRRRRKCVILEGETAIPIGLPSGCRFHPRCPWAFDQCPQAEPELGAVGRDHQAACLLVQATGRSLTDAQSKGLP